MRRVRLRVLVGWVTVALAAGCGGRMAPVKSGACVAHCEHDNETCVVSAPDADNAAKCDEARAECVVACP